MKKLEEFKCELIYDEITKKLIDFFDCELNNIIIDFELDNKISKLDYYDENYFININDKSFIILIKYNEIYCISFRNIEREIKEKDFIILKEKFIKIKTFLDKENDKQYYEKSLEIINEKLKNYYIDKK